MLSDSVYSDLVKLNEGKGELVRSFKNYTLMIPKLVLDFIGTCKAEIDKDTSVSKGLFPFFPVLISTAKTKHSNLPK